jgi:formate hydrogenlyase transcriptional activator
MGRFELAHKGTLFLDEAGDIPLELQAKLLRVLQEQEFERLGGTRTHKVDVRLIPAPHRDPSAMVKQSTFRDHLDYRLKVFRPAFRRCANVLRTFRYWSVISRKHRRSNKRIGEILSGDPSGSLTHPSGTVQNRDEKP